jgi:cell division protein FtsL
VALCLFGVVVFHVMLTQNQFRLDSLQDQALERQAEYDRLRPEGAQLESPDRIVADAQQRLGMVPAPRITYLTPAVEDTPGGAPPPAGDARSAPGTSWSVVKPHLADG